MVSRFRGGVLSRVALFDAVEDRESPGRIPEFDLTFAYLNEATGSEFATRMLAEEPRKGVPRRPPLTEHLIGSAHPEEGFLSLLRTLAGGCLPINRDGVLVFLEDEQAVRLVHLARPHCE